jgi:hypothetical protein
MFTIDIPRHSHQSVAVAPEPLGVSANRQQLWDWRQLAPSPGGPHSPANPIQAGSHRQSGRVIGRCRELRKRSCQRVGFIPPGILPRFKRLMHVSQNRTIDSRTENETFFGEPRCGFAFGSMIPLTGFRPRTSVFKSDAVHNLVATEKFGTESGAVVCARPAAITSLRTWL